jgi:hypothetical protein
MIITGLRGVGKTVLLDVFREQAERRDWATVEWEIERRTAFAPKVAAHARKAPLQIAPKGRWKERALLTTTMEEQEKVIKAVKDGGLPYKTVVGYAPRTQHWADQIAADAYALDANDGVKTIDALLRK